jgi:hypothetical protein
MLTHTKLYIKIEKRELQNVIYKNKKNMINFKIKDLGIFNFIKDLFNKLFNKALDAFKKHAEISINVVDKLKDALNSNVTDVITALIPGDVDDLVVEKLKVILPIVLEKVALANNIVKAGKSQSEIIDLVLKHLKKTNDDSKRLFWITFAAELNVALSDGKLTFSEGLLLSQLVFKEVRKAKEEVK